MVATPSLFAVTIDCPDPAGLARFYEAFLGGELSFSSNEDYVALVIDDSFSLDFQHVANPAPTRWPDSSAARRLHLDFAVDDLDEAEKHLLGIGAVLADFQPGAEGSGCCSIRLGIRSASPRDPRRPSARTRRIRQRSLRLRWAARSATAREIGAHAARPYGVPERAAYGGAERRRPVR